MAANNNSDQVMDVVVNQGDITESPNSSNVASTPTVQRNNPPMSNKERLIREKLRTGNLFASPGGNGYICVDFIGMDGGFLTVEDKFWGTRYILNQSQAVIVSKLRIGSRIEGRSESFGYERNGPHYLSSDWTFGNPIRVTGELVYQVKNLVLSEDVVQNWVGTGLFLAVNELGSVHKRVLPTRRRIKVKANIHCPICHVLKNEFVKCNRCFKNICDSCFSNSCRLTPNKLCPFCKLDGFLV